MTARKSLILITVDCLRADHCGFMGYSCATTPFLNELAGESFVFPTAVVAGVPTYYSFPAILASRYPMSLGREIIGLAVEEVNLASALKDKGYATAFFGAGNPYLSAQFGYDFGFDTFCDFADHRYSTPGENVVQSNTWISGLNRAVNGASQKIPGLKEVYDELYFQYSYHRATSKTKSLDELRRYPAAHLVVEQAQAWLDSLGDQPFFLWLHFMDPHSPYYPTEAGLGLLGKTTISANRARYLNAYWNRSEIRSGRLRRHRSEILTLYDAGIRWVDEQISLLVGTLRQRSLWENCVFALTADHGEAFLDHDNCYHSPGLDEELIHIPLMVRVPGAEKKPLSANPFSLIHLAPTLLGAMDLPIPAEFQGRNHWTDILKSDEWSEPAIAECVMGCTNPFRAEQRRGGRLLAVREARFKLVLDFDDAVEHLFDLQTDPGESAPLSKESLWPIRRSLLERALTHLRNSAGERNSNAYLRTSLREVISDSVKLPANVSDVECRRFGAGRAG